jgi:hypothetical protein
MATNFIPNSSKKELLIEFTTTILMSWDIIIESKKLFE